jgi:hypothetical protein
MEGIKTMEQVLDYSTMAMVDSPSIIVDLSTFTLIDSSSKRKRGNPSFKEAHYLRNNLKGRNIKKSISECIAIVKYNVEVLGHNI